MAEDEDGFLNLSLPQKLQLGVFGAGTLLFLFTYVVAGLLNGFNYVNTWILDNPIPVVAYWSIQIGMIPVYSNVDLRRIKWLKQSIYTFFFSGGPFILFLAYYQFHPPTTGVDRLVNKFSYIIASVTFFKLIVSSGFYQYKEKYTEE